MNIHPVSQFFWRPLLNLSCTSADRLTALFQKARSYALDNPYAKSILGRFITCVPAELLGTAAGGAAGKALLGTSLREIGRYGLPISLRYYIPLTAAALYFVDRKTNRLALAILGIALTASVISTPFSLDQLSRTGAAAGLVIGEISGEFLGSILGGYTTLKSVKSTVVLWDSTKLSESYAIGMSKQLIFGAAFRSVVAQSTLPYIGRVINLGRASIGSLIGAMAFHSNIMITGLKFLFREKKVSSMALIPLFLKTICSRYCEENSSPITTRLILLVTGVFNAVPAAKHTFVSLLKLPICFEPLKDLIQSLAKQSDKFAVIFMRAFHEYLILCKRLDLSSDPKALEAALEAAIPNAAYLSHGLSAFDAEFQKKALLILQSIRQGEKDLIGKPFTQLNDGLHTALSIHLKYFLIFTLLNRNTTAISPDEEKDFVIDIADALFSLYGQGKIAKGANYSIQALTKTFFSCKKWLYPLFEQPEEKAVILIEPILIQQYDRPYLESEEFEEPTEFLEPEGSSTLSDRQPEIIELYS